MIATVRLRNGLVALAKLYNGTLYAKTYANRTQAERAQAQLGSEWYVYHGLCRPFYVVKQEVGHAARIEEEGQEPRR